MLSSSNFDKNKALKQQITLLTMKKEHLENLITFARGIQLIGVKTMDFSVFDTRKINEYAKQAKERWGTTKEYKESQQKAENRTKEEEQVIMKAFMELFVEFGKLKDNGPDSIDSQNQVKKLQEYITENFYKCSKQVLFSLGQMYAGGGEFTTSIDNVGGKGTAQFVAEAIRIFCDK